MLHDGVAAPVGGGADVPAPTSETGDTVDGGGGGSIASGEVKFKDDVKDQFRDRLKERDRLHRAGGSVGSGAGDRRRHNIHHQHSPQPGHRPRQGVLTFQHIREERDRQRMREREREGREAERRRREEAARQREQERKQREEAMRLDKERERLRIERERLEREKAELLRLERERQRLEREKIELEREELRRQQAR